MVHMQLPTDKESHCTKALIQTKANKRANEVRRKENSKTRKQRKLDKTNNAG